MANERLPHGSLSLVPLWHMSTIDWSTSTCMIFPVTCQPVMTHHLPAMYYYVRFPRHLYGHTICAMCHPWLFPLNFYLLTKLWPSINFAYELHLRWFLHHWKDIVEIYALMVFSREYKKFIFLSFMGPSSPFLSFQILLDLCEHSWILLDHTSPLKNFWASKNINY